MSVCVSTDKKKNTDLETGKIPTAGLRNKLDLCYLQEICAQHIIYNLISYVKCNSFVCLCVCEYDIF